MKDRSVRVGQYHVRYLEEIPSQEPSNNYLVLLHGLGGASDRWKRTIPHLAKKYHVIAPDIIGYGYSDKPALDYTLELFVNFVSNFLQTLGIDKTVLTGHSLGGQIAAECAIIRPELIDKLILVSPSGISKSLNLTLNTYIMSALYPNQNTAKMAFEMISGHKNIDEETIQQFIDRISQPNAKAAFLSTLLCFKRIPTITNRLSKIKMPTLIVWGENDSMIPVEYAQEFASQIKNCRLEIMQDVWHAPYAEEPEKFSKVVLGFLK